MTIQWKDASEALQPVECEWVIDANGRKGTIALTFDLRALPTTNAALEAFMNEVFREAFAPLITSVATVTLCSCLSLKLGGVFYAFVPFGLRGAVLGAPREDRKSGVCLAWLGSDEPEAVRRFYIPHMPAYFQQDGLLTDLALGLVVTSLRGIFLGADGARGGVGPRLIVWQRVRPGNAWRPPRLPRFADVQQLLALSYTDNTPALP